MIIIINKQVTGQAIQSLKKFGEVVMFETNDITYSQVSGHPDLFFCVGNNKLVVAPNTPDKYTDLLNKYNVDYIFGESYVGQHYPDSARYNAIVTEQYLIHNIKITDPVVLSTFQNLELINIPQGYSRCSVIPLKNNRFITSDKGISRVLTNRGFDVLYVNPEGILLPGFNTGFIGGTAGIIDNTIFFIGSLSNYKEGEKVKNFLQKDNYKIIELYNGPLFDGGSLLFV